MLHCIRIQWFELILNFSHFDISIIYLLILLPAKKSIRLVASEPEKQSDWNRLQEDLRTKRHENERLKRENIKLRMTHSSRQSANSSKPGLFLVPFGTENVS